MNAADHCFQMTARNRSIRPLLAAIAFGMALAVLPLELAVLVLLIGLPLWIWLELDRNAEWGIRGGMLVRASTVAVLLLAAHLAPVKSTDRFIDTTFLSFGREAVRVDEVVALLHDRHLLPFSDEVSSNENLLLAARTVSLRELMDALNTQTKIRLQVTGCANGTTVLWGVQCFGLSCGRVESEAGQASLR